MAAGKEGFDRVFGFVGSNGLYQITLLMIVSLQCVILSWHHLAYVFLGAVPAHWCRIPELEKAGWDESAIRNFSIPPKSDGSGYESCLKYELNYRQFANLTYEEAIMLKDKNLPVTECKKEWKFDSSVYQSTIVTEFQIVCENRYLVATIQATYMCGVFLGSLVLGSLSDRIIGRRKSTLISVVLVEIAGVLASLSSTYWELIFYRFFIAFGVAGAYQNCYVLLMEYVGTKSRSSMGIVQQLPFAFGYMLMAVYAYYVRDWHNLMLSFSVTGLALFSYFWLLPESARWLAVSGRPEESLEYLMKVAKANKKIIVPEDIMPIVLECSEPSKRKRKQPKRRATFTIEPVEASEPTLSCVSISRMSVRKVWNPVKKTLSVYMSLLATPEMRRRTLLIWYLFICVDLVYYGVVFDSATLTHDPYLLVFLGGVSEIPAYTVVVPFLSKFGRRPTMVLTFIVTSIATLSVAYLPVEHEMMRTAASMTGKLGITTCFAVIYLLGTELYPTATRSTGLAAAVFMGRFGSILAPFVVDRLKTVYRDLPNLIFGIVCMCSALVSLLIPETKDLGMADQLSDVEVEVTSDRKQTSKVPDNLGNGRTNPREVNSAPEGDDEIILVMPVTQV